MSKSIITAGGGTNKKDFEIEYVTDGLMWYLDGIQNQRSGHANNITYWQDLSGHAYDIKLNSVTVNSDNIQFAGTSSSYGALNVDINKEIAGTSQLNDRTIEIVFQITTTGKNFMILQTNDGSYKTIGWHSSGGPGWYCGSSSSYNWAWTQDTSIHSLQQFFGATPELYINNTALTRASKATFGTNGNTLRLSGRGSDYPYFGKIYCIRIYNRLLTSEERIHNYQIDKQRFNCI